MFGWRKHFIKLTLPFHATSLMAIYPTTTLRPEILEDAWNYGATRLQSSFSDKTEREQNRERERVQYKIDKN